MSPHNIYINRSQTLFFLHITQNASILLCVHIYIPESNANSTIQEKTKQPYAKGIVLLELEKPSVLSLRHAKKLSSSALAGLLIVCLYAASLRYAALV